MNTQFNRTLSSSRAVSTAARFQSTRGMHLQDRPSPLIGIAVATVLGLAAYSPMSRAVTADDVACSGCVGTGDLAGNAVTGAKIQNSTITGADVGPEALDHNDILDEPGIDTPFFNGTHSATGMYAAMNPTFWFYQQQITVTHPGPGQIFCTAQGNMRWNVNASRTGYVGWSDNALNDVAPDGYSFATASTFGTHQPISTMRVFHVAGSGSKTFSLKTKLASGFNGDIGYYSQGAACMYFPTQY